MVDTGATSDDASLDEVSRLLATLIRMMSENQTSAILELNKSGLANSRIATLLGTTPGTVKATVRRAKS